MSRALLLVSIAVCTLETLGAAPKITVRTVENLESYTKVYVGPIRNDLGKVQPRVVARLKKAGFDTVDLSTEHLPFTSQGTGFLLSSEGHVLTCAHVVGTEPKATIWIGTNRCLGRVAAIDTNLDVAMVLLETNHPPLHPLALLAGSQYRMGEDVFTMGFPAADMLGTEARLNKGLISSTVGLHDDERHVQISIPIQPGNSGSPLLDEKGRVIGMVNATINPVRFLLIEGNVPQNVNFAIKSDLLRAFLDAAKVSLPENTANLAESITAASGDLFENVRKSLVLIRGGIVDEERLKERPLLCRCTYLNVLRGHFFRLRIDFVDVKRLEVVLIANLDESSTSSEDAVLDAMFEHICDKFFPDRSNPFNPKKTKKAAK